jgi:molecular chaperone GrpE
MSENSENPNTQDNDTVESLKAALEEANAKAEENHNEYLRARADLENTRKRSLKDVENARKFSIEKLVKELLNVLDSFDQGLQATESMTSDEVNSVREGMTLTKKMFLDTLVKFGVKTLEVQTGTMFNPAEHEAIAAQESDDHEPNTILTVVQSGYALNERILRPARVIVTKAGESREKEHKHVDLKA